jgi:hypothetical protein
MNYFDQLKRAAQLFRRTRALWWLGILAALFGQNEFGVSVNYSQRMPATSVGRPGAPFDDMLDNPLVAGFLANPLPYLLGFAAILLLWWLVAALVGWLAQGALIHVAAQAGQGAPATLGAGLRQSWQRLGTLFLIQLVLSIPTIVLVGLALALFVPLIPAILRADESALATMAPRMVGTILCLVPLFLLNALVGIALRLINIFAARACVLEQLTARDSLRKGWQVLRGNLGYTALNWFVFLIVGGLLGLLAALPALLLIVPVGQAFFADSWTPATTAAAFAAGAYLIVISLGAGGLFTGFASTTWTVLYQEFQHQKDAHAEGNPQMTQMTQMNV